MKYFIAILMLSFAFLAESQVNAQQNGAQFFAQFTYQESLSDDQVSEFEGNLKQNPNIRMARVDRITNGVFIVTNTITNFSESVVLTWISVDFDVIACYREGLQGVDDIIPFDENFCNASE
jgi:hypothetical protein